VSINEIFAKQIAEALNELHEKSHEAVRRDIQNYQEALTKLESREDDLYDDMKRGLLDEPGYRKQIQRVREERHHYTRLLERSQLSISDAWMVTAKRVLELATDAKSLWNRGDTQERINYLKQVCSNPLLEGLSVRYELQKPFETISKMKQNQNWRPLSSLCRTAA
jgi:hypothetical protein